MKEILSCIECSQEYSTDVVRYLCDCQGLLSVTHTAPNQLAPTVCDQRLMSRKPIDKSGVWRFREQVLSAREDQIVTHPEGATGLYSHPKLNLFSKSENLYFKHEGENPSGSFKDRGMTVAITQAVRLGMEKIACASTGNTSAALAAYAAQAGLKSYVFLPAGKVAMGKLAQTVGYGANCLAIKGDFDKAMELVQSAANNLGLYLVNSVNPFRHEGQKTIIWEILQDLEWQSPDWIVVPGGNLGNTSAFGKAIQEAFDYGWIKKKPRIAVVQAQGANPFYLSFKENFSKPHSVNAETIATAIRIGRPVNYSKAVKVIQNLNGVVTQVDDTDIMNAKREIDRVGIGCEPASACSLAGTKKLIEEGVIQPGELCVGILTGNMLKDPDAILDKNPKIPEVDANLSAVSKLIGS